MKKRNDATTWHTYCWCYFAYADTFAYLSNINPLVNDPIRTNLGHDGWSDGLQLIG